MVSNRADRLFDARRARYWDSTSMRNEACQSQSRSASVITSEFLYYRISSETVNLLLGHTLSSSFMHRSCNMRDFRFTVASFEYCPPIAIMAAWSIGAWLMLAKVVRWTTGKVG